jgi:hypothetical protein
MAGIFDLSWRLRRDPPVFQITVMFVHVANERECSGLALDMHSGNV